MNKVRFKLFIAIITTGTVAISMSLFTYWMIAVYVLNM